MGASRQQVNFNYSNATNAANQLKEVANQLTARANELKTQASELRSAWTGANANRYVQKILAEADEVFRQAKNAQAIAEAIIQTARTYKAAEEQRIQNEENAARAQAAAEAARQAAEAAKRIANAFKP